MRKLGLFFSVSLAAILTACGGGGSGGSTSAAPQDDKFPVELAFQKLFTTPASFSASATTGEQLSISFAPGGPESFGAGNPQSKTFLVTQVIRRNGVILANSTDKQYFTDAPLKMVAFANRAVTASTLLPATVSTGAAGPFFSVNETSLNSRNAITGTWTVEGVSASNAYVCLSIQEGPGLNTLLSFAVTTLDTLCFLVDKNGNASGFKADSASNSRATLNNPVIDRISFR